MIETKERPEKVILAAVSDKDADSAILSLNELEALADTGAFLEVNTKAMLKGRLKTPYPAAFLLSEWKNWGGEVIINSDCHDARYLDAFFPEAEALLLSLGYDHAVRLGAKEMWERYPLSAT